MTILLDARIFFFELQDLHLLLVPTLGKAVVQFLATSVVLLVGSHTFWSVVWAQCEESTVIMVEMLQ